MCVCDSVCAVFFSFFVRLPPARGKPGNERVLVGKNSLFYTFAMIVFSIVDNTGQQKNKPFF